MRVSFALAALVVAAPARAETPKAEPDVVELVGKAEDYFYARNWSSYYWREDFSFTLRDEKTGKAWRVISREPTPAYDWRFGTTYPDLKVDWKAKPRVKVFAVTGVDRQPAEFYDFKLDEPNVATAFVVWVETAPDVWKEYYVNNWFHHWGAKVDPAVHKLYADKKTPYDIYGFINGQSAPFDARGRELIESHKKAKMFHGLVHAADNAFGYEIELLQLIGPDDQGSGVVYFGDPKGMVPLDMKKPDK